MNRPALALVVLGLALLAGCASYSKAIPEEAFIRLSRGPCFGRCPVYTVSIDAKGLVAFDGKRNVTQPGEHARQRNPGDFAELLREIEALGVFDHGGSYVPGNPACGQYATDLPSAALLVSDGTREVRVEHYLGCKDAPASLRAIEDLVDERTGASTWIKEAPSF